MKVNAIKVASRVPAQRVMSIYKLMPIKPFVRLFLDIATMDS